MSTPLAAALLLVHGCATTPARTDGPQVVVQGVVLDEEATPVERAPVMLACSPFQEGPEAPPLGRQLCDGLTDAEGRFALTRPDGMETAVFAGSSRMGVAAAYDPDGRLDEVTLVLRPERDSLRAERISFAAADDGPGLRVEALELSSAWAALLRPGDRVLDVNGVDAAAWAGPDPVLGSAELFARPPVLTVLRDGTRLALQAPPEPAVDEAVRALAALDDPTDPPIAQRLGPGFALADARTRVDLPVDTALIQPRLPIPHDAEGDALYARIHFLRGRLAAQHCFDELCLPAGSAVLVDGDRDLRAWLTDVPTELAGLRWAPDAPVQVSSTRISGVPEGEQQVVDIPLPDHAVGSSRRVAPVGPPSPTATWGELDPATAGLLRRSIDQLQSCRDEQLRMHPTIAGRFVAEIDLEAGRVIDVTLSENTTGVPEVVDCVERRVRTWSFPATASGTIRLPYEFSW